MRACAIPAVVAILALVAAPARGQSAPLALSASELAAIDSGRQVVRDERIARSSWPRVTIHRFVGATPAEAAAVFTDYARHAHYLPGLEASSIAKQVGAHVADVDYVLAVPLFPDEDYTVRDSISRSADGLTYRVHWRMIRARSTRDIAGSAEFRPHRTRHSGIDGTLVVYDNLVVPGQALAGPLKGRAIRQVGETVAALAREIERVRREEPDRLAALVRRLQGAVERDR